MSKTPDLRRLVTAQIKSLGIEAYHHRAPVDAAFPYASYDLSRIDLQDLSRDDYELTVDLWDLTDNPTRLEELADAMEEKLNAANLPQDSILPTFFRGSRLPIDDPDPMIRRIELTFQVQLYTKT